MHIIEDVLRVCPAAERLSIRINFRIESPSMACTLFPSLPPTPEPAACNASHRVLAFTKL